MSDDNRKVTGAELIAIERRRQVELKGWTAAHDDGHTDGSLRVEAARCACDGTDASVNDPLGRDWGIVRKHGCCGDDPDEIHLLSVAGALIAAEIDRLLRKAVKANESKPSTDAKHSPDCDVNDINPDGIQKPCNCGQVMRNFFTGLAEVCAHVTNATDSERAELQAVANKCAEEILSSNSKSKP